MPIVMYHFVNDSGLNHAFSLDRFRRQIQSLSLSHTFVTMEEFLAGRAPEVSCLFTFDDGLKDGIAHAATILEEFGARGVFLFPTCLFSERRVIQAHKRGMVLDRIGIDAFLEFYNAGVPAWCRIDDAESLDAYNDPKTSQLKFLLDHIDPALSRAIIDKLFARAFDEAEEFGRRYLTIDDLRELRARGHFIGSHGHAHRWLGKLYASDQFDDIRMSVELFRERLGFHPRVMSYPFGSRNLLTERILPNLGFEMAMLDPTSAVKKENRFAMNRIDCVDVGTIRSRVSEIH
jgi:peptidoglycan/xylan/chitin deacetylase (PgdA/CDA1 family)